MIGEDKVDCNWLIFYLKIHGERNTGLHAIQVPVKLQTAKQTLVTSKHSIIEFTYSDFPCN